MYSIVILFFNAIAVGDAMWPSGSSSRGQYASLKEDQKIKNYVEEALKELAQREHPDSIDYGFMAIAWPGGHYEYDDCRAVMVGGSDTIFLIRDSCADKLKKKKGNKTAIIPRHVALKAYPVLKVYQGYKQGGMFSTRYAFVEMDENINLEEDRNRNYCYSTEYTKYSDTERPAFP